MIPYIYSKKIIKGKENTVSCNADLVILSDRLPILISLVDVAIKNKKIASDMISESYGYIKLKDRADTNFIQDISTWQEKFRYKSDRMGEFTHTVIYNTKIDDYCIDWNNEGKLNIITKWLRNKQYLPVTEKIVQQIINYDDEFKRKYPSSDYSIFKECQVYTNNDMFKDLKVYKTNVTWFKQQLETINLFDNNDTFNWGKIETIEDYLFTFLNPIKEKLKDNIKILYNPNRIHKEIYNSKYKPFDGQIS